MKFIKCEKNNKKKRNNFIKIHTIKYFEKHDSVNTVNCKFSLISEQGTIEKMNDVMFVINSGKDTVRCVNINRLFVEREKNIARYDVMLSYDDFKRVFLSEDITFHTVLSSKRIVFTSNSSFKKSKAAIRRDIIEVNQ